MDNLTHSLVGLAVGELADRSLPQHADPATARTRRRVLLATGALASNFPDLDLVLTPLLAPPLGYLLHHRGHTHTLLYALPQIALLLGLLAPARDSGGRRRYDAATLDRLYRVRLLRELGTPVAEVDPDASHADQAAGGAR